MREGLRSESADGQNYSTAASFPFAKIIDLGIWATMPDVVRAVYPLFCYFANKSDEQIVELSIKLLMKHSGLSKSSVKRAKKWLIEKGLLQVVFKVGHHTVQGECNAYKLLPPNIGFSAEPQCDDRKIARSKKPKSVEYFVYNRDQGLCRYCGKPVHEDYHLEHVIPKSQGGRRTRENTVLACSLCNVKKGCRTPEQAGMSLLPSPGLFGIGGPADATL